MTKTPRFTDKFILSLKKAEKEYWTREGQGFAIRILPSGEKVWYYIYTFDGRKRFMRLKKGGYPDVTLADAREAFDIAKVKVKNGIDPLEEDQTAKEARRKAPTVADLVSDYIERHAKRFKRSWEKDQRILNFDVVPTWGKRKAADIVKRDVVALLERIVDRGSPGMANNTFQIIRKMFNWAVEVDILTHTPCLGVKLPTPKLSRDRVFSESEIKTFWNNLDGCAISTEIKAALRLVLTTAQRPGEVIAMHTSEIEGDWWTIPTEKAKNGKAHRVYLTSMAHKVINQAIESVKQSDDMPDEQEYSGFIFPSPHRVKQKEPGEEQKSINQTAMAIAVGRNLAPENKFALEHFTPHDLRRTAATFMAESGEMDEVIDAILNHAKQGVIKVYNQYRYAKEKQQALESWARKLTNIITGTNAGQIIEMKRKVA